MKPKRLIQFLPLPQVCNLEGLIDEARAFADVCLRATGSVAPTLLALTPRGLIVHGPAGPESMGSEDEKDRFADECRLLLIASQASASAMVLESWMVNLKRGKLPDVPPSQHPERVEVVTICAETRKERRFIMLPIQRKPTGVFSGLGENTAPEGVDSQGRFAGLLPPKRVRTHDAKAAELALEYLGVRIETETGRFSEN